MAVLSVTVSSCLFAQTIKHRDREPWNFSITTVINGVGGAAGCQPKLRKCVGVRVAL